MNTQETTDKICANAAETTSAGVWGWPDADQLAVFAEQEVQGAAPDRAEMVHRMEPAGQLSESNGAYATLYFVS